MHAQIQVAGSINELSLAEMRPLPQAKALIVDIARVSCKSE